MKKIVAFILAACMFVLTIGCSTKGEQEVENVADSVFMGKVVTMDDKGTIAEAVAVKDGKIVFVGNAEDTKEYIGPDTNVYDYGYDVIYPGFIDGHSHIGLMGTMLVDGAILDGNVKLRQNAELVKAYIEENPGKEVYKGLGFWVFPDDDDPPTHEVLDKYASDQQGRVERIFPCLAGEQSQ